MSDTFIQHFTSTRTEIGAGRWVARLLGDRGRPLFTAWDRGILKPGLYDSEDAAMAAFDMRDHELGAATGSQGSGERRRPIGLHHHDKGLRSARRGGIGQANPMGAAVSEAAPHDAGNEPVQGIEGWGLRVLGSFPKWGGDAGPHEFDICLGIARL